MTVRKTVIEPVLRERPLEISRETKKSVHPEELLNSLKEKQSLFAKLKNEGLIHQNRHLKIEKELADAISDLEGILKKLEVS